MCYTACTVLEQPLSGHGNLQGRIPSCILQSSLKPHTSFSFGLGEGFGLVAGLGGVVLLGGVTAERGDLDVEVFFVFFSGVTTTLGLQKTKRMIQETVIF